METDKVRGLMKEKHVSGVRMAAELRVNPSTFYRKMSEGGKDFSVEDLYTFKRVLNMDNYTAIKILLPGFSQ